MSVTVAGSGGGGSGGGAAGSAELGRRLLAAARGGDTALVLELMAQGAPFTADWLGTSPLHAAAAGAHTDTCAVLLRAGVSRDCRTKVERTPLHLAAHAGHAPVAALLLAAGAAPDARDMLRMTPLHWAAERGHAAVATHLLRHGADPDAVSKFRLTPRALAQRRKHADVLRAIEEAEREREAAAARSPPPGAARPAPAPPTPPPPPAPKPIKIKIEKPEGGGAKTEAGEDLAAALLRQHGITLLPHDEGSTVLTALQSGRSVVLSDAGKLMLKESGSQPASKAGAARGGVVLRATPVRSPPRAGVKIFTLNNKPAPDERAAPRPPALASQDAQGPPAARRESRAGDSSPFQIKFVQLPVDAKLASKKIPMKAKAKGSPRPVKIIMHKSNFTKLVEAEEEVPQEREGGAGGAEARLRAELAAARRTIAALSAELRAARDSLHQLQAAAQR